MRNFIKARPVHPRMYVSEPYALIRQKASGTLFRWRNEASLAEKLLAALLFAVLTAMAAQMRFYLPFSPVPFTGQVLMVLVGAVLLGRFGAVAQGMYLGLGATFGLFTGMVGLAAFSGVTGGYLIGFVLASVVIGEMVERRPSWNLGSLTSLMVAGVAIIYACGVLWMSVVLHID